MKLNYPHGRTLTVWLKDASVPYLHSRHLALAVITLLVSVLLFFPYTLLLLFGHKLYQLQRKKYFHWLDRLKPLFDSYYAPYKIKARFWTGFLLVFRCALYTIFSFNSLGHTNRSLLAIFVAFTCLGFAMGVLVPSWIYSVFVVNVVETSAYLNLVILSVVTLISIPNQTAVTYSLIGIMFATAIGVIVYHLHLLCSTKCRLYQTLKRMISAIARRNQNSSIENEADSLDPHKFVSKLVVKLREPLLDDYS